VRLTTRLVAVTTLVLATSLPSAAAAADLLIRKARLLGETGASPRNEVSILIRSGRIEQIAEQISVPIGTPVLDVNGSTVIPGLVDAHVHLEMVPGAAYRKDSEDIKRGLRRQHLRAYLACGVTTVLDTGISFEQLEDIQNWLKSGHPGPRVLALGPPLSSPGGYASTVPESYAFRASVATAADVDALVARIASAGAVGVKVNIEEGFGPFAVWPIHSPEIRQAITNAAAAHHLPIYVHGSSEKEQRIGLEMGAHALVHGGFWDTKPTPEFVRQLHDSGAYVISTISAVAAGRVRSHPDLLNDPLYRLTVPAVEIETARDPEAGHRLDLEFAALNLPWWIPRFLHGTLLSILMTEGRREQIVGNAEAAIRVFHESNIPVVLGSDSGNWEIIPYEFHGPTTLRELELLEEAGLSRSDALAAATRVAAQMLHLADEIGTVEVGKRADLVIVGGDPLKDLKVLRAPRWIVQDGVARTPQEWMTE